MKTFIITVNVADREYRINIEREKEELVRKVVKDINDSLKKYADNYQFKDKQDLLAMVVMQNAIRNTELEDEVKFQQNQLSDKLEEIDRVLTEKLST